MIIAPAIIGRRVRFNRPGSLWHNHSGKIIDGSGAENAGRCWIKFDDVIQGSYTWRCRLVDVEYVEMSSEETDFFNRRQHAMRFL